MNLNRYTDSIIKTLKETPANNKCTIWEILVTDKEIRNKGVFSKTNIKLLDEVVLTDINNMKKKDITGLWEDTVDCETHQYSVPFMQETPKYEGDMVLDIKNEVVPLIILDIQELY